MAANDLSAKISEALSKRIDGPVLTDDKTLSHFSTDQSMYRVRPLAVVLAQDVADVVETVRFARGEGIPLTARGGGSGTAGAALGRGIVLAFDKTGPMNRVLDFEEQGGQPRVTVEPGLLHAALQRFLRDRGFYLPADPSSGAICLLGGNIATKASGPHAFRHGSIDRYLEHVQFVTDEGEVVDTAREESIPVRIRDGILTLRDDVLTDQKTVDRLNDRKDMKLATGYNLFAFLRYSHPGKLAAQLLVGSVGTLGVITRATLDVEPFVEGKATMLLYFRSLEEAGDAVHHISSLGVAAIEIVNHRSIKVIRSHDPDLELPGGEAHMLMVEFEGHERFDQIAQVERVILRGGYDLAMPPVTVDGEEEQAKLWRARKALLPAVRNYLPGHQALSLVNDVGVDPEYLAEFIRDLEAVFDRYHLVAAIYGHAGSGNLHLRPLFDTRDPGLKDLLQRVADDVYDVVYRYDGTITAEHGMGRLRTAYLEREWGEIIVGYMRQVKRIFDPDDLLNPDVMFSTRALTDGLDPQLGKE